MKTDFIGGGFVEMRYKYVTLDYGNDMLNIDMRNAKITFVVNQTKKRKKQVRNKVQK